MSTGYPFSIYNAFTESIAGGGPAAVVFLPTLTTLPDDTLQTIARNFNQPMTAFVSLTAPAPAPAPGSEDPGTMVLGVRWFAVEMEIALCGHATLAAAGALFADPARVPPAVHTLRFVSPRGDTLVARKAGAGRIEIALDAAGLTAPSAGDEAALRAMLVRAFGEEVERSVVAVRQGAGTEHLKRYALVELDVPDLSKVKAKLYGLVGSPFLIHVLTTRSPTKDIAFHSRMFAVEDDFVFEDPVCGSAHTLLAPYWKEKNGTTGTVAAKQVSSRGGELLVTVDETEGLVRLAGPVKLVSTGEIFL